ncbi:dienelactone hydrolase family protein [Zwartia vadi]|uniref:dienelactone hydrolase family protein n=1 Tax=Zwartia vadi TaxID=3058168 RepID=UPI0025B310B9|nr:dienelactone hydrolase [Zwartia vadi]MDN3987556.1 dienelactone hydrolase [Zwartia vadi]
MKTMHLLGFFSLLITASAFAQSKIVEEVVTVPVSVQNAYGEINNHNVIVTIFRDSDRNKSPYLILNHGRSGSAEERAKLGRAKYSVASKFFVDQGFVVIVPTRGGYGETGGVDTEYSGDCTFPNYPNVFNAAIHTSKTVLQALSMKSYIDFTKGIAVGQSFGGATAVGLAASELPGLVATFNFAGGGGGNPIKRPASPCRADLLEKLFASYGAKSKVPVYWIYSVNDKYWGEKLPKEWFEAFIKAGGNGKFYSLPAYKNDGHPSFTGNAEAWKPIFESTIKSLGFFNK